MIYLYIVAAFWLFGCICATVGFVIGRSFRRQAWASRPYVRDIDLSGVSRGGR